MLSPENAQLKDFPKKFNSIKEFHRHCQCSSIGTDPNNCFDFYLDFIGYSINRYGFNRYNDQVYNASKNGFGFEEICLMADSLKLFEDICYEDAVSYTHLTLPTKRIV